MAGARLKQEKRGKRGKHEAISGCRGSRAHALSLEGVCVCSAVGTLPSLPSILPPP